MATSIDAPNDQALTEVDRAYALMVELYESRIGQLELQIQEQGWMRMDDSAGREFGREALDRIVDLARVNYLKNPIINRAVEISALYTWGQDLAVNAEDAQVQAVVDRFWRDNLRTLTGQQASRLLEVELQVTGNIFLALFPDAMTGSVRVRTVPMEEIREIVANPEDRYEPWYYRREWTQQPVGGGMPQHQTAYYPDWQYQPAGGMPARIGDHEVRRETPLIHVKVGAFPHWRWGVSEVYAALDWARAYKEQLEDDATRSRALARFAWSMTTKGGVGAVAAAKARLGTSGGLGAETNPPPVVGSTFIAGDGVSMDPIRIAGATLPPEHSTPARRMASAALGIPDHFFDANQSNLATSKTLDRPTELRYSERRALWRDVFSGLLQWAIDRDIAATSGILRGAVPDDARTVDLSWPSLLEREAKDVVAAIVSAATLDGHPAAGTLPPDLVSRQLMAALGVKDIDGELANLSDEGIAVPEREAFIAALRDLREALRREGA